MSMFSQIQGFDRTSMNRTTTRVRTSAGKLYEENIQDEQLVVKFVGNDIAPAYLEDSINGFTAIIPGKYDTTQNKWTNFIYNSENTYNHTDCNQITFITYNIWFVDLYIRERAAAVFEIVEKKHPDIL